MQSHPNTRPEECAPLRVLDEFLNSQILAAEAAGWRDRQRRLWDIKVAAKRQLATVPPGFLDRAAQRIFNQLRRTAEAPSAA